MSKKHFIAIARDLKDLLEESKSRVEKIVLEKTARRLADTFAGFNDNFDRGRFLSACGF